MSALPSEATRRVAGAVAVSTGAQILAKAGHFVLNVVAGLALIRYFGPSGYGDYVFIFSYATLFGLLSDFGISRVAVRDMARDSAAGPTILGTAFIARLGLAGGCLVLAQAVLIALGSREELRVAVAVASLMYLVEALLSITTVFQVRLAMQYEALVTLIVQAVDTVLILALIAFDSGLLPLVAAPVASGLVGVVVAVLIARHRFDATMRLDLHRMPRLLLDALPLGMTSVLVILYLKADSVLLGVVRGSEELGLYGAAYRPIEYVLIALAIPANVLFPLLARWSVDDRAVFRAIYQRGAEISLAMGLWSAVALIALAEPLVRALYADEFDASAGALRILAVGMVMMAVGVWEGYALLAAGRQVPVLWCNIAGLVANLGANVILIPQFGYMGAAVAAAVTGGVVSISSGIFLARDPGVTPHWSRSARVCAAAVITGAVLWAAQAVGLPWLAAGVLGSVAYPFLLLLLGATSIDDLRLFLPRRGDQIPARPSVLTAQ